MSQITTGGTASSGAAPQDNPLVNGLYDGSNVRYAKSDANGNEIIVGPTAATAAITTNPVLVAGGDGSNVQLLGVNAQNQLKVTTEGQKATYTAVISGFVPAATATDFINIPGSASKTVKIVRIGITGTATANAIGEVFLLKRSTANSSGTPTAAHLIPHDANDSAATITINSYAANPTTGTLVNTGGQLGTRLFVLAKNDGTGLAPQTVEFLFGKNNEKAVTLRGVAQNINLNWNGAAIPSGAALDVEITWTEE